MLNAQIAELEQAFREQWDGYRPDLYLRYLEQVASEDRNALLARFLAAELEYVYQPPNHSDYHVNTAAAIADDAEDDDLIKPNVILLLHRFPEIMRDRELAVQLIMLEFALRLRFDTETPHYDSYLQICPDQKDRLEAMMALLENKLHRTGAVLSASANHDDTTVSEEPATHKISLAQLPYCLGYFLLTDVIGQGGMGTVYNAIDLRSAAHVAVKVISGADSWSIYRFIEEFTWLSKLNHPNLVRLYDTFSEGDLRFFSMEVVEGQSIRDWFAVLAHEDRWERLRQVLSQAALAIAFLHEQQVIHRDIKSSNLMISREGRAVLLDLGLAMRAGPRLPTSTQLDGHCLVGTLYSLAPEVLNGATPVFASDWYSFGVMIFETITGNFPLVQVQLTAPVGSAERYSLDRTTLIAALEGCPADLASLCVDLLSTLADERPTVGEILERLGSQAGQPIPLMLSESDFVGRSAALAWLDSGLEFVHQGKPALRLLRGDSGLGKSTVLQHWLRTSASDPVVLSLNLRCHSQDHTPLRALNLLVQELVNCLLQQPPELWLDLAHGGGEEIVFTFPQMERLGHVAWPKPVRLADSVEGVARRAVGLHALMGWLKNLSQRAPIIISIDDAQWADAESGRILAHLLQNGDEFRGLLIVIDQGTEVASPLVQRLLDSDPSPVTSDCIYELPPLTREECEQLLQVWSQRLQTPCRAEVIADILDRSKGSPFLLQELLRSYVNYAVRNRLTDELWLMAAKQNRVLTSNRFSMLPAMAEKILQFLAVSPQPLSIQQLQTVSRVAPGALLAELRLLVGQGWIRWNGAALDSEVEISHEQFRTVVLEAMHQARLQRRHYRLARMLSLEVPPPWRRIAHHYAEAQQPREAAACFMEGARAAARRLSYDEALWMLERAFHPLAQRSEAEQRDAMRLRADCLAGQGNAMAAAKAYTTLAQDDAEDRQLIRCLAGEQWIRAGRLDNGMENLKSAFEELGVQRGGWGSPTFRPKRPEDQTGAEFSEVEQCLNRLSGPLTFLDDQLGASLTNRMFQLALKRGSLKDQAIAALRWALLANHSDSRSTSRALQWLRQAQGWARRSGSPHARALSHGSLFIWKSLQGEFHTALRYARRMERMFEAQIASDTWDMGYLRWLSLTNLWYLGRLREQRTLTTSYRQDASRRADSIWNYWMHVEAAHLSDLIADNINGGRHSLLKAGRALDAGGFQSPQVLLWLSHLRQQLYEGQALAVRQELLQTQQDLWKSSFIVNPFHKWLFLCLRIQCDLVCCSLKPQIAAECLRDARRETRQLAKLPQSAFRCYYQAFQLVIDAASGSIPSAPAWQAAIDEAQRHHLGLLENALSWHLSNWHPQAARSDGQARLRAEGVVNPARLMNLILPLAHDQI